MRNTGYRVMQEAGNSRMSNRQSGENTVSNPQHPRQNSCEILATKEVISPNETHQNQPQPSLFSQRPPVGSQFQHSGTTTALQANKGHNVNYTGLNVKHLKTFNTGQ